MVVPMGHLDFEGLTGGNRTRPMCRFRTGRTSCDGGTSGSGSEFRSVRQHAPRELSTRNRLRSVVTNVPRTVTGSGQCNG